MTNPALLAAKRVLPSRVRQWLRLQQRVVRLWLPIGWVRPSTIKKVTPVSRTFGLERGQSICRYYIDDFLRQYANDIRGSVLEVADNNYTLRFGGASVRESEVLHVQGGNPKATIVADLTSSNSIAPSSFDCIILTQTLQFIYDTRAAVRTLYHTLKPGGVLLATFPGISQISRYDMDRWGEYWRFTTLCARKLFEEAFAPVNIKVEAYGNVLAANAYLYGLAAEELSHEELEYRDPDYEVLIAVRATKAEERV
jgi:SAM-dependent methyltransferase